MLNILAEPKNALIKQYKKLFKIENIDLEFEDGALRAIVQKGMKRGTGARALRSILEEAMLEIMYRLPSDPTVSKCIITKDTIVKRKEPTLVFEERKSA
jgi:ATP-dependent Clp protease ATP-binding subunit ClpX